MLGEVSGRLTAFPRFVSTASRHAIGFVEIHYDRSALLIGREAITASVAAKHVRAYSSAHRAPRDRADHNAADRTVARGGPGRSTQERTYRDTGDGAICRA